MVKYDLILLKLIKFTVQVLLRLAPDFSQFSSTSASPQKSSQTV